MNEGDARFARIASYAAAMSALPSTLLYGLVAALSPLALASTLAVLKSRRARINGSAFAVGFLFGQSLTCLVAVFIGSIATPGQEGGHDTVAASISLALGIMLLATAWHFRRPRERPTAPRVASPRTKAFLERLGRLHPAAALSVGFLLGIGGPKRLTVTLFFAATLAVSGLNTAEEVALGLAYVVIASVLVWLPVGLYVVAGERANQWMAQAEAWLIARRQQIGFGAALVLGLLFTIDALVGLL
jgi:Sap, sulfolipid-1-addressing protein